MASSPVFIGYFLSSKEDLESAHISSLFLFAAWEGVLCHYLDYVKGN
jgi:hypothetical protein